MSLSRFIAMSVHENRLFEQGFLKVAGIDEAGRGPLAGPVVAAACILTRGVVFRSLNDSKQLSPEQRESLYRKLSKTKGVEFGLGLASVEEIDQHNIFQANFLAMQRAVQNLPTPPEYLLIDGNLCPYFTIPKEALVKGDCRSISIAAASIIAKVSRDKIMEELDLKWPEYGFRKHKGYATKQHLAAIEKWGPCPIHRKTFTQKRENLEDQLYLFEE